MGEVDIYRFCDIWAEEECTIRDVPVNGSNKRNMLSPLLRKIPFCSMTQEQFTTEVSGEGLLNGQEELQIFRFFCAVDKSNPPFPCKANVSMVDTSNAGNSHYQVSSLFVGPGTTTVLSARGVTRRGRGARRGRPATGERNQCPNQ